MVLPDGSTHYPNDDSSRALQRGDVVARRRRAFPRVSNTSQKGKKRKKTKKGKRENDDDDKEEEEEVAVGSEEFRKEYVVGTVAETYHDSDSELYEEDQVLENDTEVLVAFEEIPEGANWTRYKEFELFDSEYEEFVCCKADDLKILDRRYFEVGDDCVKAKNTLGMCGKIVDMNVKATLFCPATKEYAHGVDSKECQELRRVYPQATVVYGNWVGVVETVTDVVRLGLLKDDGKKAPAKKKKTGKRIQASWPLQAKDAFIQKEQDREDVENHSYLNEELPDLLVEVKTSGQSYPDYASDGEELSDEEEQEFYYLNTLGIRHCDRDEKDRVYRFHLSAKECGVYRPGDIVDVEESKVAQAVEAISERVGETNFLKIGPSGRLQELMARDGNLRDWCFVEAKDLDELSAVYSSAFAIDNEETDAWSEDLYDAKMADLVMKVIPFHQKKHSLAQRAVVKSIHDGMATVNWKVQHLYEAKSKIQNAYKNKNDPLRRVAPKKLPIGYDDEKSKIFKEGDAPSDGNPEHFLPPWCESSCEFQNKPPPNILSSMLTVVDMVQHPFIDAGHHVLCSMNALEKFFPEAHKRALRFEEKREKLWLKEEKKARDMQNFYKSSLTSNDEIYCVRVMSTETTCEVLWQDGSRTFEMAKDLLKLEHLEDHVYRCGDFVVKSSEFNKALGSKKVVDLEQMWEDELMRKREQYSEKMVLDTFAVGYVEAMNSEERTADIVWVADAFVFEAPEDDIESFLAEAEGLPPYITELKWREDWNDSDFLSEGTPPEVSIADGGASYFENHYNKYYADAINKFIELEKGKIGRKEGTKRGVVRFKSRETVPVYALQQHPAYLFEATGCHVAFRNIPGLDYYVVQDEFRERFSKVDSNEIVSASTEPKVLDNLVEQWGSTRFMRELKNHDIFNRDLAPPDALKICDSLLSYIHDTRRRRGRHYLCSAVKDVFVPFYERKLQVIPGDPWSVPEHEENVYWFQDSSTSPKRISPTSPEWCHPGEGFAELWGFAAAGAYEQRHTKHPRQRFDARDNLFSSYVQDVSWVGEILESSGGLFKIAWRNGTVTHQPPFNIEMCGEDDSDSDDSDSDDSDSDNSMESDFSSNSQSSWETDSGEEGSESDPMEEEDFDEESDDGSGSEDIDVRNDDGVDVQNTSRRNTTERGAGLVPIFGSLLDGQLESIRRMVETWTDDKLLGHPQDQDDVDNTDASIDAHSISRLVKNALPPGLFDENQKADTTIDDIMERYKKMSFNAKVELKKILTKYSDEELKLLIISTHFWRCNYDKDDELLGENAGPSDLEKDFVKKTQLNAEYAGRSRRLKDTAHPRNIAEANPCIFLDRDVRTKVFSVLSDCCKRSNRDGLKAFHSLVEANEPPNNSRDEIPSLLDSLNFVWRQERRKKVKQFENLLLYRNAKNRENSMEALPNDVEDPTIASEDDIDDEDEELSTIFDIVEGGFPDFLLQDSSSHMNLPRKVQKAVQKEWSILQKGLPVNEIWVKASQTKVNVMRAMVKGPQLTPYHDGLFCFDILFDENYPSVPPKVHYHSYGYRLNPNLYEEGKICLSLLNTWDSEENSERWSKTSSALQVLVSIQALVLNDKPYYNEAGYERQRGTEGGIRNSAMYSENAYLLNLKTMVQTIKRPPIGFEALVRAHFKSRRAAILKGIAAYLEGAPVGSYCDDPDVKHTKHDTHNVKPTKGFLLSLEAIQETVKTAFQKI